MLCSDEPLGAGATPSVPESVDRSVLPAVAVLDFVRHTRCICGYSITDSPLRIDSSDVVAISLPTTATNSGSPLLRNGRRYNATMLLIERLSASVVLALSTPSVDSALEPVSGPECEAMHRHNGRSDAYVALYTWDCHQDTRLRIVSRSGTRSSVTRIDVNACPVDLPLEVVNASVIACIVVCTRHEMDSVRTACLRSVFELMTIAWHLPALDAARASGVSLRSQFSSRSCDVPSSELAVKLWAWASCSEWVIIGGVGTRADALPSTKAGLGPGADALPGTLVALCARCWLRLDAFCLEILLVALQFYLAAYSSVTVSTLVSPVPEPGQSSPAHELSARKPTGCFSISS